MILTSSRDLVLGCAALSTPSPLVEGVLTKLMGTK